MTELPPDSWRRVTWALAGLALGILPVGGVRTLSGQRLPAAWTVADSPVGAVRCCSSRMFGGTGAALGLGTGYVAGLLVYRLVDEEPGPTRGLAIGAAVAFGAAAGVALGHRRHGDRHGAWRWALLAAGAVALPVALAPPCGDRGNAECGLWGIPLVAVFTAAAADVAYSVAGH